MRKWPAAWPLLLLISLTAAVPASAARFVDIGATLNIPPAIGGAWGDYDNDGDPDLYVDALWGSHRAVLYHNNGDGTFTDVTVAMGLRTESSAWEDWGAAWGDFNNDGRLDLVVVGGNHPVFLYRNDGDHFTDIGGPAGGFAYFPTQRGVAWGDYDGDNWLDLYICYELSDVSRLYRNNRDETFTEVTNQAGMEFSPAGLGIGASWADYNGDGLLDLMVTRMQNPTGDLNPPRLYQNNGDGTFHDAGEAAGLLAGSTNGLAWGDYDNDGLVDLYLGGNENRSSFLYHNNGDGTFTDLYATAIGAISDNAVGVAWADYDNDGFLDLAQVNSRLPQYSSSRGLPFLFHNEGNGTFAEQAGEEGMTDSRYYRTASWADYDLDGSTDLFAASDQPDYSVLYHNGGSAGDGNWLRVRALTSATGDATDGSPVRDALGARVWVSLDNDTRFPPWRTISRLIDGGSSFMGQNEQVAHFGLGEAQTVAVRVAFPDHSMITQADVAAGQQIEMRDTPQAMGTLKGTITATVGGEAIYNAGVTCGHLTTRSSLTGAYRFPSVPSGVYEVAVTAEGYQPETVSGVVILGGETTTVDFALSPAPGTIQGIVTDSSSGFPISGATVTCADEAVTTGGDGAYSFTLESGTYEVSASAPGYESTTVTNVVVIPGQTTTLDLSLTLVTGLIAGKVTNALTHAGVTGATVQSGSATTVSNGSGQYQLSVPPGADLSVTVTAAGYYGRSLGGITVTGSETTPLDIALTPRTGTIIYRVKAYIDSRDDLVIQGSSLQWHHIDGAAPGLWDGHNEVVTISSTLNGTAVMDGVTWTPLWPNPYPDENTDSSVFTSLAPALPGIAMTAVISAADGPMPVTITQAPTAANEYTLIVHFQDDVPDAHWYDVQIAVTYQGPFTDVATDHWAADQIAACVAASIVQGYWDGAYHPERPVTRGQMAIYIARTLAGGESLVPEPPEGTQTFPDVDSGNVAYYKYVEYCATHSVVQGFWDGSYKPDKVVNRGQMAIYIARALVTPSGDAAVPEPPPGTQTFPDVTPEEDAACFNHVEYLAALGVVEGFWNGTYHPEREVRRDQMAVYIARAFELPM